MLNFEAQQQDLQSRALDSAFVRSLCDTPLGNSNKPATNNCYFCQDNNMDNNIDSSYFTKVCYQIV